MPHPVTSSHEEDAAKLNVLFSTDVSKGGDCTSVAGDVPASIEPPEADGNFELEVLFEDEWSVQTSFKPGIYTS